MGVACPLPGGGSIHPLRSKVSASAFGIMGGDDTHLRTTAHEDCSLEFQSEVLISCVSGGSEGWSCVIEHPHPCYSGDIDGHVVWPV